MEALIAKGDERLRAESNPYVLEQIRLEKEALEKAQQ